MDAQNLRSIIRRYVDGQSLSEIAAQEGFDRKTIRRYLKIVEEKGIQSGGPMPSEIKLIEISETVLPTNTRRRGKREELERHKGELVELLTGESNGRKEKSDTVKPKTAYRILRDKYELDVSYETFKLYVREIKPEITNTHSPLPIELEPGSETQIDYCSVGYFTDPKTGKRKKTYGFVGKLSSSRLPFVEYCHSQDQVQFVSSNVRMVEFYGGVTERLVIDNLKSGVLKPDIYDPTLNRAYADFAEYYGTFIDTARVAQPTDKAKVERLVQEVKELFRYLVELHPSYSLAELNREALKWCKEEYGMREHGTTGEKPTVVWREVERQKLTSLPATAFEVPDYKWATVGPDRFFSYKKKRYAMPEEYRGKKVLLRASEGFLRVFDSRSRLLRQYLITGEKINSFLDDFPEDRQAMMRGSYPQYLIRKGRQLSPAAEELIREILTPHAWVRARAARGVLNVLEKYTYLPMFNAVCSEALNKRIFIPKQLKALFEESARQYTFEFIPAQSEKGKRMTRSVSEYLN
jgi:transposase